MAQVNILNNQSTDGFTINGGLTVTAGNTTLTPLATTAATGVITIDNTGLLAEVETGGLGTIFVGTAGSPKFLAAGAPGNILTSQGAGFDPQWSPTGYGLTQYGVVVGSATGGITSIPVGNTGEILMGSGVNPFWTGSPNFGGTVTIGTLSLDILELPTTTPTVGQIIGLQTVAPQIFMHAYGTRNTFLGGSAGSSSVGLTFNIANATDNTGIGKIALTTLVGTNSGNAVGNTGFGDGSGVGIYDGSYNSTVNIGSYEIESDSNTMVTFSQAFTIPIARSCYIGYMLNSSTGTIPETSDTITISYTQVGMRNPVGETFNDNTLYLTGAIGGGTNILKTYISGIYGTAVTGLAVTEGQELPPHPCQLGTASSSIRFKENIKDIENDGNKLMSLRPITFTYKNDKEKTKQYGLIAEEVAEIFPELVSYDKDNLPFSVYYEKLPALLLNEIQKLIKRKEYIKLKLGEI